MNNMSTAPITPSTAHTDYERNTILYWEQRARAFAERGQGLGAVCSYGMPSFYNHCIQATQRCALAQHLRPEADTTVLDLGCGVGRWSRWLAARGAQVTGVDLSPTMIEIARRRARDAGLTKRCRFLVQDVAKLDADGPYDLVLAVTVLQHILDPVRLQRALERMSKHLAPGGRMVLLEAAPAQPQPRCDGAMFTARPRQTYIELLERCGLTVRSIGGVDPSPFRIWLLPYLRMLPRTLGYAALTTASALSLPMDLLLRERHVERSWHAVFVAEHASGKGHAH
jgi:ubiquinone/menaquinone biosynthesis C-methylase UbiE